MRAAIRDGLLSATTDMSAALANASAIIIVVPLIVDDNAEPDFTALDSATAAVGGSLQAGTLVSYETTLPVGTTRNRFVPALEKASGLHCGEDLFVVFSPNAVYSGRIFADLKRYPKLVGGVDEPSTARAIDFYESLLDFDERPDLDRPNGVWDLGSSEASEFAKLAETTYRDVNIGLANEFARFADTVGVDIARVIAGIELATLQSHPPAAASLLVATASPSTRASTSRTIRAPWYRRRRVTPTNRCRRTPSGVSKITSAHCETSGSSCSAPATGAASRRPPSPVSSRSCARCPSGMRHPWSTTRCSRTTNFEVSDSSRTTSAMNPMPSSSRLITTSTGTSPRRTCPAPA